MGGIFPDPTKFLYSKYLVTNNKYPNAAEETKENNHVK